MSFLTKLLIPVVVSDHIIQRVDDIYKSVNDVRQYRYLELDNGLKVALVK